jgi:hypothetical protein
VGFTLFVDSWQERFVRRQHVVREWLQLQHFLPSLAQAICGLLWADGFTALLRHLDVLRVLDRDNCLVAQTDLWKDLWVGFVVFRRIFVHRDSLWVFLVVSSVFGFQIKLETALELNGLIHIVYVKETFLSITRLLFLNLLRFLHHAHSSFFSQLYLRYVYVQLFRFFCLFLARTSNIVIDKDFFSFLLLKQGFSCLSLLTLLRVVKLKSRHSLIGQVRQHLVWWHFSSLRPWAIGPLVLILNMHQVLV